MARNEEKQLARLNRFYLQKQREEDLKKRPPRPKLETLTTPEELRKWLPSITRDIEFYVKQMEVTCYRDHHIEEFNRRIGHLRGEYKAFVRKLRELDPDSKKTPWSDRPYKVKKYSKFKEGDCSDSTDESNMTESTQLLASKFIPLQTPVLDDDKQITFNFGYEKRVVPDCPGLSDEGMNQPLIFSPVLPSKCSHKHITAMHKKERQINNAKMSEEKSPDRSRFDTERTMSDDSIVSVSHEHSGLLNLPYSDSSSSDDET